MNENVGKMGGQSVLAVVSKEGGMIFLGVRDNSGDTACVALSPREVGQLVTLLRLGVAKSLGGGEGEVMAFPLVDCIEVPDNGTATVQ